MSARSEYSDVAAMADDLQQPNDFSLALAEIDELREANARLRHTLYGSDDLLRGVSRR